MLDGGGTLLLLHDQHLLARPDESLGDEIPEASQAADDDVIAIVVAPPAKRELDAPLDNAVHREREDHPDEARGREDQPDSHELAHHARVQQADVAVAHGGDGDDDEVRRVQPREVVGGVEIRGCRDDERDETAHQGSHEAVCVGQQGATGRLRRDVPQRVLQRHLERVNEGGCRNPGGVEHLDPRVRRLQVRRDVLVEQRHDDARVRMNGKERHEHLEVALILIIHHTHRAVGGQHGIVEQPRDHLERRRALHGLGGVGRHANEALTARLDEHADSMREVTRPDHRHALRHRARVSHQAPSPPPPWSDRPARACVSRATSPRRPPLRREPCPTARSR